MPDLVTHYYFGEEVLKGLDFDIKEVINNVDLYFFTTGGPDPFFFYKFLKGSKNSRISSFGNFMHRNNSYSFFKEMLDEIKSIDNSDVKDTLFSFLCGFITHYSLDSTCHPYIFHKTGEYKKTKETMKYRGLHMKLERAIDSYFIKENYKLNPNTCKIYKKFLPLKELPISIKPHLNKVFKKVYFNQEYINFYKEDFFKIYNDSLKSQTKCYKFIYDPIGFKQKVFSFVDKKMGGTSSVEYSKLSYYKKSLENIDIFNTHRDIWCNPTDTKLNSYETFFELMDKAKILANKLITVSFYYAYKDDEVDLTKYFKNLSYLTGIDCNSDKKDDIAHFNMIF